jgi:hypothetical protein
LVRSFVDRRLERDKVRFVAVVILALNVLLAVVSFLTFNGTHSIFGPAPGFDFAGFYSAGRILNDYPPHRLYDLELQDKVFHQVLPGLPPEAKLPYVYPPFFSLLFRPLALLPYAWACLIWMLISAGLYLSGFALLWRSRKAIPADELPIALLLALSFEPFVECWLSGQTSAVAFAALALALRFEALRFPFRVGLSLALCLYKPPLLLVIVPMQLIAGRWRVLGGLAVGGLTLAEMSLLAVGWRGCAAYVEHLSTFSQIMSAPSTEFPSWKFVDLDHFLGLLFGGHPPLQRAIWALIVLAVVPCLARFWWGFDDREPPRRSLLWSATLTWTLVLNVYIGTYDAVLAVPGLLLTTDVLCQRAGGLAGALSAEFKSLLALVYLVPWLSQFVALSLGFQPFTLILMGLGTHQLTLAWRAGAANLTENVKCFHDHAVAASIQ